MFSFLNKKNIFLDYASATPLSKKAQKQMQKYFIKKFFNPSAIYTEGLKIHSEKEKIRERIAKMLHARAQEIIFTDGASEANNLVIQGLIEEWNKSHKTKAHILSSALDHPSVRSLCKELDAKGKIDWEEILINEDGMLSLNDLKKKIKAHTLLVSVPLVNGEIGTKQDIKEIAKLIRHHRKKLGTLFPYLHTDASQAGLFPIDLQKLGIDFLVLSAGKIYGPKKMALLYRKNKHTLSPILFGGAQEFSLRPGTENIPYIVAFNEALKENEKKREKEYLRLSKLQKIFEEELKKTIPLKFIINGEKAVRSPHITSISIEKLNHEEILHRLDAKGIKIGMQSACNKDKGENSQLLSQMRNELTQSIRFSFGRDTQKRDLIFTAKILGQIVQNMGDTFHKFLKQK